MSLTFPQFSMAFTTPTDVNTDGTWQIDITLSGTSYTVSVASGSYFMDGTTGEFFETLADALTAADILETGDGTALWTVGYASGGRTIEIVRTGISKSLTKFNFDAGQGANLGATKDTYTWPSIIEPEWAGSAASNPPTGTTITFTGIYQCGLIWLPEDYLMRNESKAVRTIARSQGITGRVLTDFYSNSWHTRPLFLEPVQGARVHQWVTDDAVFAAEAGVVVSDPNVALESFWGQHALQTIAGVLPTVRLAPDKTDLTTYSEIWLAGERWLTSMAEAATEVSSDPLLYTITFQAQTVVG